MSAAPMAGDREDPTVIWWSHFERAMLAFEDLGCEALLDERSAAPGVSTRRARACGLSSVRKGYRT
jgi:hypothetical protein